MKNESWQNDSWARGKFQVHLAPGRYNSLQIENEADCLDLTLALRPFSFEILDKSTSVSLSFLIHRVRGNRRSQHCCEVLWVRACSRHSTKINCYYFHHHSCYQQPQFFQYTIFILTLESLQMLFPLPGMFSISTLISSCSLFLRGVLCEFSQTLQRSSLSFPTWVSCRSNHNCTLNVICERLADFYLSLGL